MPKGASRQVPYITKTDGLKTVLTWQPVEGAVYNADTDTIGAESYLPLTVNAIDVHKDSYDGQTIRFPTRCANMPEPVEETWQLSPYAKERFEAGYLVALPVRCRVPGNAEEIHWLSFILLDFSSGQPQGTTWEAHNA